MSQTYKGFTIPTYTDVADAPRAFQDLVDDIAAAPTELPAQDAGTVSRALQSNGTTAYWGSKTTVSTAQPSGGSDGDVWYVVP
jgi:hypothetical protein